MFRWPPAIACAGRLSFSCHPTPENAALAGTPADAARPTAATLKPMPRSTPIGSTFVDWAMLAERPTANGIFRAVFDAPAPTMERLELHVSTLNPGKSPHPPHFHPWEEILILKDGRLDVIVNGELKKAAAGAVVFFASNDAHTVANVKRRTGDLLRHQLSFRGRAPGAE